MSMLSKNPVLGGLLRELSKRIRPKGQLPHKPILGLPEPKRRTRTKPASVPTRKFR